MKKLIGVELYKVTHYWLMWGVLLFAVVQSLYVGLSHNYQAQMEWYIVHYPKIEYIAVLELCSIPIALMEMLMSTWLGSADFSAGTVRNALSVGVSRSGYFFSRLAVNMLMTFVLSCALMLSYGFSRFCRNLRDGQVNTALSAGEYAVIFLLTILQLCALSAFANMLCYFLRNQLISMVTFLGLLYSYAFASSLAEIYGLDTLLGYLELFPIRVLERCTYYAAQGIFQFDSLKSGLSALAVIMVCSAAGYVRFRYSDHS